MASLVPPFLGGSSLWTCHTSTHVDPRDGQPLLQHKQVDSESGNGNDRANPERSD